MQWLSILDNFTKLRFLWSVRNSRWWGSLTRVPAGNKAKGLSSVNHTTKTIHHYSSSSLSTCGCWRCHHFIFLKSINVKSHLEIDWNKCYWYVWNIPKPEKRCNFFWHRYSSEVVRIIFLMQPSSILKFWYILSLEWNRSTTSRIY